MNLACYPSLSKKAVLVTGGASGIGAAMVNAFARQNSMVGFIDIDGVVADQLCDQIVSQGYSRPWFQVVDVCDTASLKRSIGEFIASSGCIDVLVNNVGADPRQNPLEITEETWRKNLAINLDPAFFAAQSAIECMLSNQGGSIINLSSIVALIGRENMPGYIASKAAVLGLTKALARQYGPDNIRVNSILPGWVATERQLSENLTEKAESAWMEQVALKRRIMPIDIANLALFLAADDSKAITNQHFTIDGGRT